MKYGGRGRVWEDGGEAGVMQLPAKGHQGWLVALGAGETWSRDHSC
jgi:hypothetical protein